MKKTIYMDHSATTYVDEEVVKSMQPYFNEKYGNPGSVHHKGLEAKQAINTAREEIADILGCETSELIFTGGGTESINLAIKGVALALKNKGKHIITSRIEHHAVLDSCEYLERYEGFEITYLDVDRDGLVDIKQVEKAIRKDTTLITIMYANNEIGTIQPIREIGEIARKNKILFHTDACQAAGLLDINVQNLNVDLMTLNGSKIYGPKGIGLLYAKKGIKLVPLIHGGGQERGLRSGTENVPYIIGFAKALKIAQTGRERESKRLGELRDYFINRVLEEIPNSLLNGHATKRLPNNINISFLNVEGEAILLHLDKEGICASTGSACTSGSLEPSHVILATGLPYELAHGSIRFSLGKKTTKKEIDSVMNVLPEIINSLRQISPVHLTMKEVLD